MHNIDIEIITFSYLGRSIRSRKTVSTIPHFKFGIYMYMSRCIPIRRDTINSRDKNKTTTIIMNESFHTTTRVKRLTLVV